MLHTLAQDIRYALRTFARSPGMVAAIVVSIALGIAANTTVFSMVNAIALATVPVSGADRLVNLDEGSSMSWPDYVDYRDQVDAFEDVAARFPLVPASIGGGEPERVWGQAATANYFQVLGIEPVLGRGFLPEESVEAGGQPMVVILGDALWRRRFGASPSVLGETAILNNRPYTIIGVMPPGFHGEENWLVAEFWVPVSVMGVIMPDMADEAKFASSGRDSSWATVTARIKPGISRTQAAAALNVVKARIDAEYRPDRQDREPMRLGTAGQLPGVGQNYVIGLIAALMIVVGLVLLVACANVANLLLARATGRQREVGIRLAMGATRRRLIRQLLTESVLLAIGAAVVGVALSYLATRALSGIRIPMSLPLAFDFTPDIRVLLFTAALAVITGVVFGLAPAFRATRADLVTSLKNGGGSFGRFRRFGLHNILVSVQVAMTITLLVSAGLFLRSLGNASSIDTGMQADNVLVVGFDPKLHSYSPDQTRTFLRDLRQRVGSLPGVRSMSYLDVVPLSIGSSSSIISAEESTEDRSKRHGANITNVGGDYFRTMGIPIVRGRDFNSADLTRDAAIINQQLAERLFGAENPIGRQIYYHSTAYEVVGVVGNTKLQTHGEDQRNAFYSYVERDPEQSVSLFGLNVIVKTDGAPRHLERAVRQEIHTLDPNLATYGVETMEEHFNKALLIPRISASLFSVFGAVGLTLATVGLYGVMSYSVRRRTKEIGIRLALGARAGRVLADVVRKGLSLAGVGLVIGLAAAVALSRLFQSYLYGMKAVDPFTFIAVPLALLAIALVAILVPARRAARIEPSSALRYE